MPQTDTPLALCTMTPATAPAAAPSQTKRLSRRVDVTSDGLTSWGRTVIGENRTTANVQAATSPAIVGASMKSLLTTVGSPRKIAQAAANSGDGCIHVPAMTLAVTASRITTPRANNTGRP